MRRRERGGKKGRRGSGGTRGIQVWGKGGKVREGHEETSQEVSCSEDVRLEVRVLHDLHREVIVRQTRTKHLAARHCAARVSGLHASDTCRRLTLHTLKKGLVRNPREIDSNWARSCSQKWSDGDNTIFTKVFRTV